MPSTTRANIADPDGTSEGGSIAAAGASTRAAIAKRGRHRCARIQIGEVALQDHRADRVAERCDEDRRGADELVGLSGHVDPDQRDNAGEPNHEPREPLSGDALGGVEPQREQGNEQRGRSDQYRGERRRDVQLPRCDQRERQCDLDDGEHRKPHPAPAQRGQQARVPGERQQNRGAEHDANPGQERRRNAVVDRHLYEQVRNPPEDRNRGERRPRSSAHIRSITSGRRSDRPDEIGRTTATIGRLGPCPYPRP